MEETVGETFRRLLQQERAPTEEEVKEYRDRLLASRHLHDFVPPSPPSPPPTRFPYGVRHPPFLQEMIARGPELPLPKRKRGYQTSKYNEWETGYLDGPLPEETHTAFNPWKTKSKTEAIPDWNTKALQKRHQRPYFSPVHHSWEIDIVHIHNPANGNLLRTYLFCININTKYLVVIPITNKTSTEIKRAITELIYQVRVEHIRGDYEGAFTSHEIKQFFADINIAVYFTRSRFINRNRVVDRVIRTIRDGFGMHVTDMRDNNKMQEMVDTYNNNPHMAYNNIFTPWEVEQNPEIEARFIAFKKRELKAAVFNQKHSNLHNYKNNNVLYFHLDESKTDNKFSKQRRRFNHVGLFIAYRRGNVLIQPLTFRSNYYIEIPIYFTKLAANSLQELPQHIKHYFRIR